MGEKERTERLRKNAHQDPGEKAADTHSTSWCRRVTRLAGLVLISWTLSGSQVVARECYECGSSKSDNGHYAYAEKDRVVSFDDVTKKLTGRSSLWESVKKACIDCKDDKCDTSWSYTHCCYNKVRSTCKGNVSVIFPIVIVEENQYHFLLVPTDPVTGVEDTKRDAHPYWQWAWSAAAGPYNPIKHKILDQSIGLAINPKTHRGQDQLHIHIGSLRNFLKGLLSKEHVPHDGGWHQLPLKQVYNETCYAKFVNSNPFPSPFKEVSGHFGEANMQHAGIILAGHVEGGMLKGYYIVSCYDVIVEDWLYYKDPGH